MFIPRQHCAASVVDVGFLSYRKLRFHTIKTLREDRTAAEWKNVACATRRRRRILLRRILFYVTERDKAFWYQLAKHLSEAVSLIRMEFSKRAWYTQLNKIK